MFELLRKKLGNFAEQVKKKIEQKGAEPEKALIEKPEEALEKKTAEKVPAEKPEEAQEKEKAVSEKPMEKAKGKKEFEEKPVFEGKKIEPKPLPEKTEPDALPLGETSAEAPEEEAVQEIEEARETVSPAGEKKRELKPSVSIKGKLKAAITGAVVLKEDDLKGMLWQLELSLLEADVEQTTAEEICGKIKERLSGKSIGRKEKIDDFVKREIGETLLEMMQAKQVDLLQEIKAKKEKPYRILFLGPNGSGKTTSIAKLTWLLQSKGLKVIWAASDTFRAASIEQLEKHAEKLNVRVVKHQYGADPAAVAFDAVKAAQGKGIEVVLIDSAGRQETNRNLMGELQKIVRVAQPDLKIYVGEAYTGQALLQQAKEYDKMIGIDAFILTKIDCDAKGGTTISLLFKLRKPILFVGTGQEYKDLQKFEPEFVLEKIIG